MTRARTSGAAAARAAALPLLAAATLGGCESQWFLTADHAELVTTEVVVRTDPPGAMVWLNGTPMDRAPVRIPVEYDHIEQQWLRQTNAGSVMLEDMGTLTAVLTFPVWGVASLFHGRQEMKRHVYGSNRHVVTAQIDGREEASREITLEGQAEVEVSLVLPKP